MESARLLASLTRGNSPAILVRQWEYLENRAIEREWKRQAEAKMHKADREKR